MFDLEISFSDITREGKDIINMDSNEFSSYVYEDTKGFEDMYTDKKICKIIERIIHSQKHERFEYFIYRYELGYSNFRISEIFNVHKSTVTTELTRARRQIKKYLIKKGLVE